jgi:Putative peptidoglycan binding domain
MAFGFIGKALSNLADASRGIGDEVGDGRANREDDVVEVKRAFAALGRLEEPEDEPSGLIDRALDTALHGFQRDKGLRVDGFMRPGGPTERSLQYDVRGLFRKGAGLESARGDGLGSLVRAQGSFGGGSFDPASALGADARDAGQDEGRSSPLTTR